MRKLTPADEGIIAAAADDRLREINAELLMWLKKARECIAYCRRNHPDAQLGDGIPVEVFIDAAIAKAEGRA